MRHILSALVRATTLATTFLFSFSIFPASAQDVNKGQQIFKKCRVCHMVGDNAKNRVGPILNGIIGRKAATVEKFKYSPAMKAASNAGLVWTEAALDQYLSNPRKMVPQTRMTFAGIPQPIDRKNLIAYLKTAAPTK